MKRPFVLTTKTNYNYTFFKDIVPLKEEDENRAIVAWIYKEETPAGLIEQSHEITSKKYGPGLKIMKCFGFKGTGPIGCNKNGLIDLVKVIARRN